MSRCRSALAFVVLSVLLMPAALSGWSEGSSGGLPAPGLVARENLLHRCRSCRVVLAGESWIEGRLVDIRSDSLEIEVTTTRFDENPFRPSVDESARRTIPLEEVASVRCGDRNFNGLILGFLAGGVPAAAIASGVTAGDDPDHSASGGDNRGATIGLSFLSAGVVGALVGYLVDSASGPRGEVSLEAMRRVGGE